jgi:hypothetical protein
MGVERVQAFAGVSNLPAVVWAQFDRLDGHGFQQPREAVQSGLCFQQPAHQLLLLFPHVCVKCSAGAASLLQGIQVQAVLKVCWRAAVLLREQPLPAFAPGAARLAALRAVAGQQGVQRSELDPEDLPVFQVFPGV